MGMHNVCAAYNQYLVHGIQHKQIHVNCLFSCEYQRIAWEISISINSVIEYLPSTVHFYGIRLFIEEHAEPIVYYYDFSNRMH